MGAVSYCAPAQRNLSGELALTVALSRHRASSPVSISGAVSTMTSEVEDEWTSGTHLPLRASDMIVVATWGARISTSALEGDGRLRPPFRAVRPRSDLRKYPDFQSTLGLKMHAHIIMPSLPRAKCIQLCCPLAPVVLNVRPCCRIRQSL